MGKYDVTVRRQMGNFPPALTHIALINTAHNIHHALNPAKEPAHQRAKGTPEKRGRRRGQGSGRVKRADLAWRVPSWWDRLATAFGNPQELTQV